MGNVSEQVIAGAVVYWLKETGWEVYQEVVVGGPRADIIATQGPLLRVIEVKTSFTTTVVEQAWHWCPWAHFVHIAIPSSKSKRYQRNGRSVLRAFCRDHGIGVLDIRDAGWNEDRELRIDEDIPSKLRRSAMVERIRKQLRPEHQRWGNAGNADHQYWTPWRGTCEDWRRYVEKHPGCTLKEIIEKAGHHYRTDSTARSCMAKYLSDGVIDGIVVKKTQKGLALYLKGAGPRKSGRGRRPKEQQP